MLGSDGGPQTRKPVPGGAVGLAGTEKSTQDLFRLKMVRAEGAAGAGARRLARRAGERCAQQGRLRQQRQGNKRSRALRLTSHATGRTLGTTQPAPAAAADAWRGTAAEGAYTDGTFDEPQDLTQVTRPPADAPARGTVPKQKPDDTSKHPIKPTMAYYVPRQMREKLDQKPAADPSTANRNVSNKPWKRPNV